MQFLVLTTDAPGVDWKRQDDLLRAEARTAYGLWQKGVVRQLWFTEEQDAVIILECANKRTAKATVESLPLIKHGLLRYTLTQLSPYPGFDRLLRRGPIK